MFTTREAVARTVYCRTTAHFHPQVHGTSFRSQREQRRQGALFRELEFLPQNLQ